MTMTKHGNTFFAGDRVALKEARPSLGRGRVSDGAPDDQGRLLVDWENGPSLRHHPEELETSRTR
jgi:hypothetical protein